MKCLNMKVGETFLFVINFVMIYQMNVKENKTSQIATLNVPPSNVDKDCPQLSKIIHDNNLTDYKNNCTPLKINNEVNIENVLQQACFAVSGMLDFICDKKLNATADLFRRNDSDSVCPFSFSHLEQLSSGLSSYKLLNELKNKDHCLTICSDLYSNRTVCVLLSKLNHFLKSFTHSKENSNFPEVNSSPAKFQETKIFNEKISEGITVKQKLETSGGKLIEPTLNATKSMKNKNKDKNAVVTSGTEVEQKSNYKTEPSKNFPFNQENNEIIENENLNEEKAISNDNEEDEGTLDDSFPDKADISLDLSKMGSSDAKIDSPPKQKEIYSREGFFSTEDSHFFFYLIMMSSIIVIGYIAFHNKNKILAYALEGTSGRRSRRRPNPARYRKLETNLEEVISSNATNAAASNVVY